MSNDIIAATVLTGSAAFGIRNKQQINTKNHCKRRFKRKCNTCCWVFGFCWLQFGFKRF